MKTVLTALFISVLLVSLAAGIHIVKADSNDYISFSGGLTIFSPINETYNSNFLTLNLTFGCGAGIQCSLNYSLDGKYEGPIPLVFNNSTGFQLIYLATGLVQLPELSKGSHRLTIYVEGYLYDYHGANPPGAPFKPTTPNGSDYVASWVDTVDFTIDSSVVAPPSVSILTIENKTYNATDILLNFTVNENISKATYSLDGKDNVTIAGNTTLTGLSVGAHNLTVYAWNDAGNIGASEIVRFTTAKPEAETIPTATVAAVLGAAVVVAAGLLVYFKKRKR